MSSNNVAAVSAFIEGAPPGELTDVVNDIKALTPDDRNLLESARPAFKKYNEEQLTTVKLPGGSKNVLISQYNTLEDGRYYDVESQSSFAFDHMTQKASDVRSHVLDSEHKDLITSLLKSLNIHAHEHYPSSSHAIFPTKPNTTLAILLTANKYSPANFWNGRLRTTYLYSPTTGTLIGTLKCDVHYFEDGNVRLTTKKEVPEINVAGGDAGALVRAIAKIEKAWQEELNRGFGRLSEGEFKSLRRQLPVTRQKVEWEKVGSYKAGKEIGGGRR
ncbi:hypothetical protein N7G274_002735 [Stereocaulon virgatum]|uniref:F-actin-capping protein subunit alpha n=1 Tax=Stereocaulon virgatum TaxID=373712 RepID=A0ABR4AGS7_9LECA